ncbi:XdhC family protein [Swingsia samuiensis]|uniref:XdhC family protein n=1 Tax=Swingsia samuiensis TaxID=1293412 RepID=A0A4Y6UMS7_9PROT|nr:XdhC family protein [Swingsia samuiensis]QDH17335.1 XdhC family protein [Swingsia samuiensis]
MSTPLSFNTLPPWPEYGLMEDFTPHAEKWLSENKKVALATLVKITGSSPRPLGSEMLISEDGEIAGYVSGGCVESAIQTEAVACIKNNTFRMLDYGANSPTLDVQLTCGGRINIFVRPIRNLADYIQIRRQAMSARQPIILVTDLNDGEMFFTSKTLPSETHLFQRTYTPKVKLILVGHDPVTLALVQLAPHFNLDIHILRPKGPEFPPQGIPLSQYDRRDIITALSHIQFDQWTAVYSLTHDAETDLIVAERALQSDAFCVGILGSRKKIPQKISTLKQAGISDEVLTKLQLPAGLDIGAQTPMEIALSILSQIIAIYRAAPVK